MDKPVICPTFIGRTHERGALIALIEAATHGQGHTALISGEAGIGKSRLVAEAKAAARSYTVMVVQGQCFETDATYPYAPLLDLLRAYLPDHVSAIIASGQEAALHELAQLLPDLALRFPQFAPPISSPASERAHPDRQRQRLVSILTQIFTDQAARQPIVLVIEDVHWCDESTLDVLLRLTRQTTRAPILLLLTYRSDDVPPLLANWLAQLDRERLTLELRLSPLSRPEVDAMAQAILAVPVPMQRRLAETIHTLAEGNPFFVEEVLESVITAGELWFADGHLRYTPSAHDTERELALIPRSVQGTVRQRMAQLNADAQQALTLAAVAGRRFDFAVLQRLMACDEHHLIALMKELIVAHLVVEESAEQFAFRHALIRQAIYRALLARERRSLHQAIANTLEALYSSSAQGETYLADLASHCYLAGDWAKALAYEQRAAETALSRYAPRATIEHATHALDAAHHMHSAPPGTIYYTRGQARETLGEFDRARRDYEHALAIARTDADDTLQWQSLTALGFLWAERDYTRAGEWFRRASALAERLADPGMQARSLNRLGNWLGNTGRIEEGLQAHRDALTIFEGQHDTSGMAETLDLLSTLDGMRGDRITAVAELGQAITLFRTLGDMQSLISSLAMRAIQSMPGANETTCCPQRTRDECVQDASESLQVSRQIDSLAGQSFAEVALAHVLTAFGEFGSALAHAHEAQRIAREIEHQQWLISSWYALGRAYVLLLAPDQAITALATGLALAPELDSAFWIATLSAYMGRAYILKHDLPAAQATIQAVMPREQLPRTIAERDIALTWGELALAQGEPTVALQIAEHLLATVPGQPPGQPTQPIPHLLRLRGEALLDLSRLDEAVAILEDARRGAIERHARPLLWMIHRSLGRAHQLLRRDDEARRDIAAARRLIEELATTIEDGLLHEAFTKAAFGTLPKGKPLPPREASRQAFGGLTAREREVAVLLAEGKTSRQITDALVVSERTAEAHVSNILRKLGFSSRIQIAVWVVERGLANR